MAEIMIINRLQRSNISLLKRFRLGDSSNPFGVEGVQFMDGFGLSRRAVEFLCEEVNGVNVGVTGMPLEFQILIALRMFGSGNFQNVVGDGFNVSQSSVSRYLYRIVDAICRIAPKFVVFPLNQEDIQATMGRFQELLGFPNVVGAIDCTHIYIDRPATTDWFVYLNRKGKFSVNVQMICDANMKITDVVARWPGSTHDSFIWNMSACRHLLADGVLPAETFLLGDNGYPLEPYLLTPYLDAVSPSETLYNKRHRKARNVIERCFGVLKARFQILGQYGGILRYEPQQVCKIVIAAAVLHNICLQFNVVPPPSTVQPPPSTVQPPPSTMQQPPSPMHDDDDLQTVQSAVILRDQVAFNFQAAT